jgi:hypothetical protein
MNDFAKVPECIESFSVASGTRRGGRTELERAVRSRAAFRCCFI